MSGMLLQLQHGLCPPLESPGLFPPVHEQCVLNLTSQPTYSGISESIGYIHLHAFQGRKKIKDIRAGCTSHSPDQFIPCDALHLHQSPKWSPAGRR